MGSCRAATITGTLSRISLNDDEDEKGPEGLNFSTLPGNIISKVIIQQPPGLHMPLGVGELGEQCHGDAGGDMRRTVYLCTDDAVRSAEQEVGGQGSMMEADYIVMPRGSGSAPTLVKDDGKMGLGLDALPRDRLAHYKVNPDFGLGPAGMEHMALNLEQPFSGSEHGQNLPFEPRTAVKNFLAEMEESAGMSRSETGSTISMSSLEVRTTPDTPAGNNPGQLLGWTLHQSVSSGTIGMILLGVSVLFKFPTKYMPRGLFPLLQTAAFAARHLTEVKYLCE